jgi:hypothetical protein
MEDVRFKVFAVFTIQVKVMWVVTQCNVTVIYQHFGGPSARPQLEQTEVV